MIIVHIVFNKSLFVKGDVDLSFLDDNKILCLAMKSWKNN